MAQAGAILISLGVSPVKSPATPEGDRMMARTVSRVVGVAPRLPPLATKRSVSPSSIWRLQKVSWFVCVAFCDSTLGLRSGLPTSS